LLKADNTRLFGPVQARWRSWRLRCVRQKLIGWLAPKVERSFSPNLHSLGGPHLAIGAKRSYLALTHRHLPMLRVVSTSRKGMKMTTSNTFTIHAGCSLVRTDLHASKRWQGICHSTRM
jgi:hypothetical protein